MYGTCIHVLGKASTRIVVLVVWLLNLCGRCCRSYRHRSVVVCCLTGCPSGAAAANDVRHANATNCCLLLLLLHYVVEVFDVVDVVVVVVVEVVVVEVVVVVVVVLLNLEAGSC